MTKKTRSETGYTKVVTYAGTFAVLVVLLVSACTPIAGFSEPELSICGFKFHDLNENGVFDKGEPGLEGWTFELYTCVKPDVWELIDTEMSDSDGYFCFEDIYAGEYYVREILQDNWYNTTLAHQSVIIEDSSEMLFFGNAQEKETWDKSNIEIVGECESPYAVFTITNTGDPEDGDMQQPTEYRVYRNDVLEDSGYVQLAGGDSIDIVVSANCDSIRLEADQSPGHPGNSHSSDVVEECGCEENGDEEEQPKENPPTSAPKKSSTLNNCNPMPIAIGDGPYHGTIGELITFNGSASKDDGSIIEWFWEFGDGTTASGEIVTHAYTKAKTYAISLTVTDNYFSKSYTYKTIASISQPNRAPQAPEILGLLEGIVNAAYSFTAISHDPDGDNIGYTFDWGDGETNVIPFVPAGYHVAGAHSWKEEGTYTITVSVSDGELSASADKMIRIEAQTPAVDYAIVVGLAAMGAILLGLFVFLIKRGHNK